MLAVIIKSVVFTFNGWFLNEINEYVVEICLVVFSPKSARRKKC